MYSVIPFAGEAGGRTLTGSNSYFTITILFNVLTIGVGTITSWYSCSCSRCGSYLFRITNEFITYLLNLNSCNY